MATKPRFRSNQIRKEIKAAKKMAAFTKAIQQIKNHNQAIAKEVEDQATVKQLMQLSNEQSKSQSVPSRRRYDANSCPVLLQEPCTSQERAAQLITTSEPLCYLGDMPLYR